MPTAGRSRSSPRACTASSSRPACAGNGRHPADRCISILTMSNSPAPVPSSARGGGAPAGLRRLFGPRRVRPSRRTRTAAASGAGPCFETQRSQACADCVNLSALQRGSSAWMVACNIRAAMLLSMRPEQSSSFCGAVGGLSDPSHRVLPMCIFHFCCSFPLSATSSSFFSFLLGLFAETHFVFHPGRGGGERRRAHECRRGTRICAP